MLSTSIQPRVPRLIEFREPFAFLTIGPIPLHYTRPPPPAQQMLFPQVDLLHVAGPLPSRPRSGQPCGLWLCHPEPVEGAVCGSFSLPVNLCTFEPLDPWTCVDGAEASLAACCLWLFLRSFLTQTIKHSDTQTLLSLVPSALVPTPLSLVPVISDKNDESGCRLISFHPYPFMDSPVIIST